MRKAFWLFWTFAGVVSLTFLAVAVAFEIWTDSPPDPMIEAMLRKTIGTVGLGLALFVVLVVFYILRLILGWAIRTIRP